jgi:outer membrane immunogenic protein
MKRTILAALAATLLAGTAYGADIAPMYKAVPQQAPAPAINWTGFHIGLNAGWLGSTSNDITSAFTDTGGGGLGAPLTANKVALTESLGYNGFLGGGQIGYNWQTGMFVVGFEGDFDGVSASSSDTNGPFKFAGFVPVSYGFNRELDWLATVRGKAGITVMPSLLFYATGGLAVGEVKLGNSFICPTCAPAASTEATTTNTQSNTATGWTVGAGAEWMFAQNWSIKVEYLYVDLGSSTSTLTYTYGGNTSTMTSTVNERENVARGGINYRF